jgi:hypothetical protein
MSPPRPRCGSSDGTGCDLGMGYISIRFNLPASCSSAETETHLTPRGSRRDFVGSLWMLDYPQSVCMTYVIHMPPIYSWQEPIQRQCRSGLGTPTF